jgi:hypothetical protein
MLDFPKLEFVTSRHLSMSNKRILWRRTLSDFGAGDDTDSQVSSVQIVTLQKQGVGNHDQMIIARYCARKNKRM